MNYQMILENERMVLSLVLVDNKTIDIMKSRYKIQGGKFADRKNGIIFAYMDIMHNQGIQIDIKSLAQEVSQYTGNEFKNENYISYIAELSNLTFSSANMDFYCKNFCRDWKIRETQNEAKRFLQEIKENPQNLAELTDKHNKTMQMIESEDLSTDILSGEIARDVLKKALEFNIAHKNKMIGIPCGFYKIDERTKGFRGGELITLGAVAGGGKTAMSCTMIYNILTCGYRVALFSLEMSKVQILERLASISSKIPLIKIRNGDLEESEKNKILQNDLYFDERFFLVDTPLIEYNNLLSISNQLVKIHGVDIIFIDYAQLIRITGTSGERKKQGYEILTELANNLKSLAKSLNVPIVALSQINSKGYENKPDMNNLSGGLAFTQASDYIFTLWESKDENGETIGRTFEALKGRNIKIGAIPINYNAPILKFES